MKQNTAQVAAPTPVHDDKAIKHILAKLDSLSNTQAENKDRLTELLDIITAPKDEQPGHGAPAAEGQPPTVWFLLGLIAGCITAVVLVSQMNANKLQNKKIRNGKFGAPSSGSAECIDEEKCH